MQNFNYYKWIKKQIRIWIHGYSDIQKSHQNMKIWYGAKLNKLHWCRIAFTKLHFCIYRDAYIKLGFPNKFQQIFLNINIYCISQSSLIWKIYVTIVSRNCFYECFKCVW